MDNILTLSLPPEDLPTAVATWVLATLTHTRGYNNVCVVVNNERKQDVIQTEILRLLKWAGIDAEVRNGGRIKVGDESSIEVIVGMDCPPLGQTFTKVFLIELDAETKKKAIQYLAPIAIVNNDRCCVIVNIESWKY